MNAWILRPYPHGINRTSQFVRDDFIAIGWPGIGDLYSGDKSDIYQKVSALYLFDYGDKFCRESSNTIWKFIHPMLINDIVLVMPFREDSLEVAIGQVDSSYFFDARYDEMVNTDTGYNGFSHRRKMIWLEKKFPRNLLPESVRKAFTKNALHPLNLEGYNRLVELLESRGHRLHERLEMSQYRKQLIETSTKMVLDLMQQKMPDFADIFGQISHEVFEVFKESESVHFDLLNSKLTHVASGIEAYLIPIEINFPCQKQCISLALDKWDASHGFCEIANQTMTYWLTCLNENRGTLLFTSAWDEVDFITRYKPQFDAYAQQHNIAVILVTTNGFTMTYMGP